MRKRVSLLEKLRAIRLATRTDLYWPATLDTINYVPRLAMDKIQAATDPERIVRES
jgi:hypothetical protein